MENVTDALYMGFAVLVFVLAISISIGAFTQVTQVSNYIVESKDQETLYTYVEYDSTERIVSGESIVPTLYRAPKENYIVRFRKSDGTPYYVYKVKDKTTLKFEPKNEIDLRSVTIGNQADARILLDHLLEGTLQNLLSNDTEGRFSNFQITDSDGLSNDSFYGILKRNTFIETLGIYYEDDLQNVGDSVDDINKTEVRLITYTFFP